MSHCFQLTDPETKRVIDIGSKHYIRGATYDPAGSSLLDMDITTNYTNMINDVFDKAVNKLGIYVNDLQNTHYFQWMNGKTGAETSPVLLEMVVMLKDDNCDDYWKCTEGNCRRALTGLLTFAIMRPKGIWDIFG